MGEKWSSISNLRRGGVICDNEDMLVGKKCCETSQWGMGDKRNWKTNTRTAIRSKWCPHPLLCGECCPWCLLPSLCGECMRWIPLVFCCPFDCAEFEDNLDNEEEGIIMPRPQRWAAHMVAYVRQSEHVQWMAPVVLDSTLA